jgi:non-ribosomal peptide synthetase component F
MLRSNGIEPGMRVGVCAAPCAALFATILAIWSVGAVYVPLDPALPDARLAGIASGAALALAVVASENAGRLGACPVLSLTAGTLDVETWPSVAAATGNAYLLYTSGSTGEPKGVEIPHRAATNAILAALAICGLRASDSTLYRTAISFDLSVYDIFTSLAAGATLVIAPAGTTGDHPRAPRTDVAGGDARPERVRTLSQFAARYLRRRSAVVGAVRAVLRALAGAALQSLRTE